MIPNVKRLRKEKGITQAELAKLLGTTRGYISQLETGRTHLSDATKKRLSDILAAEVSTYDEGDIQHKPTDATAGRIKTLRGNLSQREFAKKIGCSQSLIAAVEKEVTKPSESLLKKIAAACDVSYDWLLYGEDISQISQEEAAQEMRVIDNYLSNNRLARKRVIAMIMDGSLGS